MWSLPKSQLSRLQMFHKNHNSCVRATCKETMFYFREHKTTDMSLEGLKLLETCLLL